MSKTESSAPPFYLRAHGGAALVLALPVAAASGLGCGGKLPVFERQPLTSF
jgi:hypothetical protein